MLRRGLLVGIALALSPVLLAGCGGKKRLSASQYRTQLGAVSKEAGRAQANVEKALQAKTLVELRKRLLLFSGAERRLGDEVAKLDPPKDAQKANDELARGEHDTADEVRAALAQLPKATSVKAALTFLNKHLGQAKGGREIDQAVTELKKLGYTKGS